MKVFKLIALIVCFLHFGSSSNKDIKINKSISRDNRLSNETHRQPTDRINTTNRLAALREVMKQSKLQAFLITSDDEHQTEFVSDYDKRLQYISGFTGSSGNAIVTLEKAALWTDSRYHLQADFELDCNWLVMKAGNDGVPSKEEWLKLQFPYGATIGADPKLIPADIWNTLDLNLKKLNNNFTLVETNVNLVDVIWTDHNETDHIKEGFTMGYSYTGKNWTEKINETRQELKLLEADAMVVTALDEIAWLLNIRGYDIPYSYLLKSYVVLSENETILYANPAKVAGNITAFFETKLNSTKSTLIFRDYQDIWTDLPKDAQTWKKVLVPTVYVYSPGASKKIYDIIPEEKRLLKPSPIIDLKAKKNPTEILGMERSHIRDSAAICRFFHYFESRFDETAVWDELRVTQLVDRFRSEQNLFLNISFSTIVAFGVHGALPHYQASINTSSRIFKNSTLVIDSGGQYYDGTTDVTRTVHMGTPTPKQMQAYTRVLMGTIQLSSLVFPDSLNTAGIDILARSSLWEMGYDYPHGTGHGIGVSLIVHESPISISYKSKKYRQLKAGYFLSNEPGCYHENEFGIRLENIMEVIEKPELNIQNNNSFLSFKDVTLVPYDMKLVDLGLLNNNHIKWLNAYNTRIRDLVGPELRRQKALGAFNWMMEKTEHIPEYILPSVKSSRFLKLVGITKTNPTFKV